MDELQKNENLNQEEKNFLEKAKETAKNLKTEYEKYKEEEKRRRKEKNEDAFLLNRSDGWWIEHTLYVLAILILIALALQGLNSWYYFHWNELGRPERVWNLKPEWLSYWVHWFLSKDSVNLPLNIVVWAMVYTTGLLGGVEISYGMIKSKEIEVGKMTHLPFKQRFRFFKIMIMWFLLCCGSVALKFNLGTRGFEYYLEEQFWGFALSIVTFSTSMKAIKSSNQILKGAQDKANEKITQDAINKETEKQIENQ